MSGPWSESLNLLGTWLALLLTLFIFSSLLRENWLSRLAEHLLVGAAAGYAGAVVVRQVLVPRLVTPLLADPLANWHLLIPAALALLWFLPFFAGGGERTGRRMESARLAGSLGLALLFGVGAGLVVGGAWQGTLWPQALAAARLTPTLNGLLVLIATLGVPLYLHGRLRARPSPAGPPAGRVLDWLFRCWGWIGQAALLLAFGVIFARAGTARLALLIDRLQFVIQSGQNTGLLDLARRIWERLVSA